MTRFWRVLPLIATLSLFLYIANLVVYEALAGIFTINATAQLAALGVGLGVMSGSFIAATLLGSWYYNFFTRLYYLVSAVWIGFFVYFFFAAIVYGLATMFGFVSGIFGMLLFGAALAVGAYGVVHARNIQIKEVKVSLPHLPPAWRGRRAVWMSDLHLGQLHGPGFARRVVNKVNSIPHDIIFIGGDLYDGTGAPDIDELTAPLKELRAPLGTYFIIGNHEEFGDNTRFIKAVNNAGMRVLQDKVEIIDGLQLAGVDYHNASDKERFKNILAGLNLDARKPSILLKHEPKDLDVAEAAGISLQVSGHTHRAQQWPLVYVAQLTYKGFAYGLKRLGAMQIYTSSGTGTWGPPLRVGTSGEVVVFIFDEK